MNIMMTLMNSCEACKKIKQISRKLNQFVPAIFLTASQNENRLTKCFDPDSDDFASKPFSVFVLLVKSWRY